MFIEGTAFPQITWRRSYGAFGLEKGYSVEETADGHIVVCGSTGSFGAGGGDAYLLYLDEDGELQWSRTFGGPGVDEARELRVLPDGGVILAGLTNSEGNGGYDGWLVRTDPDGVILWERKYGGPEWDIFNSVDLLGDGFLVAGCTYGTPSGESDIWVMALDADGEPLWSFVEGGVGADMANAISAMADGGAAIAATGAGENESSRSMLLRLDSSGSLNWARSFDTSEQDEAHGIVATSDGGIVICGVTAGYTGFPSLHIVKVNGHDGDLLWEQVYPQEGRHEGRAVRERSDGKLVVAGLTEAFGTGGVDAYIMLTDEQGVFENGTTFGSIEYDDAVSVAVCANGGFLLAGMTTGPQGPGPSAVLVVRTDQQGFTVSQVITPWFDPLSVDVSRNFVPVITIFPNPTASRSFIHLKTTAQIVWGDLFVIDQLGRVSGSLSLDPSGRGQLPDLAPGTYLLLLSDADGRSARLRLVVE
ncbi:MAG: PQQ-binding-like beta-propeller repeat protein [Flavobacteriales bacterium]|nr:PQQ-binding-like beta-propeller repeat protein [Flavobacteriales bacterium]